MTTRGENYRKELGALAIGETTVIGLMYAQESIYSFELALTQAAEDLGGKKASKNVWRYPKGKDKEFVAKLNTLVPWAAKKLNASKTSDGGWIYSTMTGAGRYQFYTSFTIGKGKVKKGT